MEILKPSGPQGHVSIVLHAHLPYIRYPEHEDHLEERWLHEAVTETYIPLLHMFETLLNDGIDFRITLSLTPTLIEMFNDGLLMERYQKYLCGLIELSEKEIFRTRGDAGFGPLAGMYHKRFLKIKDLFENVYRRDLTGAFGSLPSSGKVEIITSAATHAYLPALITEPSAARAQIMVGAEHFRKTFGKKAGGIWLPECGYAPGMDSLIKEAGLDFFFLESHGLLNSNPRPRYSIYSPVRTPSGAAAFSRDVESAKQVWSSAEGYPGDFDYRDFYRDIGFDLDFDYIGPYLPGGIRTFTGLKYYRVTGKSDDKRPYVIEKALGKVRLHADHFLAEKENQVLFLHEKMKFRPLITAAYDAELFGHWWFEGPEWLDLVFRKGSAGQRRFRFTNPSEYLADNQGLATVSPSMSSWGNRGYSSTWIDPSNDWIYRHLNRAARFMREMASENMRAAGVLKRALNQAARELLLAQASDWPFMMKGGNSEFATRKFEEHMNNFFALHRGVTAGRITAANIASLEYKNGIFPDIDYRVYANTKK